MNMATKDFLDELVTERTRRNPDFPRVVEEASARRALGKTFVRHREAQQLTQMQVAAQMRTSASVVSKLEGGADMKVSTLQRYLAAIRMSLAGLTAAPARERRVAVRR